MPNFVKPEGELTSKLWIIGEAPGANEDKEGRPFVGGSGMVLSGMLSEVGIQRRDCYIDNVVQYQPPDNNFGVYYQDSKREFPNEQLVRAHERIKSLVLQYRPNVVLALGNESLYALTGKKQITKWRGSILSLGGVKVIPTHHPAMIMRQYEWRTPSLFDMTKAKRESYSPAFPELPEDKFKISPSYEEVMTMLEYLKGVEYLSFDIETDMKIHQILCIAFAWSKSEAICIPIFHGDRSIWTEVEELAIIRKIKEVLEVPRKRLIAQNAQFDMMYLKYRWDVNCAENLWMDTMVAHHCVYPELNKGLGFLVSIYTNHPYHKDMIHGGQGDFYIYNCMDAARTYECAFEIEKELKEWGTWEFYNTYSAPLIKPLFEMQLTGCRIDIERRAELDSILASEYKEMLERLHRAVGYDLNPNSTKQMPDFLYTKLGLPTQYKKVVDQKTKQKKESITTDDNALEFLIEKFPRYSPILKLIQDIREVRKLLSTYVRAELDKDNRIRCSYNITGTVTGRLSSSEGAYGTGTNLQNIPRGPMVRSLFIPDEECLFVNADLSQAEARVVAFLAEEERLQTVFEQGGDIHRRNAAIIFGKPVETVSEEERELGKKLVHAANYGIGVKKFSKEIKSTEDRARELLNTYYAVYPRIKRWHSDVQDQLRKTRVLTTPLGRKRFFFGRWNDDLLREAIAYVPQSTVGDVLNLGLVRAFKNLPVGWKMALQNHDAIMLNVPAYTPHMHIHKFIKHYLEIPIQIGRGRLTIPVDIKIGKDWGHLKKLEL